MIKQWLSSVLRPSVPVAAPAARPEAKQAEWATATHAAYPRLMAPLVCRPSGPFAAFQGLMPERRALRGLVVLSDDAHAEGTLLELEVFAGQASVTLVTRVEAVNALPPEAPARFDVVLQVCDMDPADLDTLKGYLK